MMIISALFSYLSPGWWGGEQRHALQGGIPAGQDEDQQGGEWRWNAMTPNIYDHQSWHLPRATSLCLWTLTSQFKQSTRSNWKKTSMRMRLKTIIPKISTNTKIFITSLSRWWKLWRTRFPRRFCALRRPTRRPASCGGSTTRSFKHRSDNGFDADCRTLATLGSDASKTWIIWVNIRNFSLLLKLK